MDAGSVAIVGAVAALLGAAIGAGGAIAAATVAGRTQIRGQHAQWQRETRRDAYIEFVHASRTLLDAVMQFHGNQEAALADGSQDQTDRRSATLALFGDYDECVRALGLLELERSSPAVRTAAWHVFTVLARMARRQAEYWDPDWVDDMANSMPSYRHTWNELRTPRLPGDLFDQSLLAQEKINNFLETARADLA
ncbi:hypothetical protein ACFU96_44685 [Streptomyces sp. NPDC057620]|uniref:hypothetical protein n=1 Tax=Streptomyces sp. NPDC057620 TaxID=3346185 RepID=UPI0036B3BCF9